MAHFTQKMTATTTDTVVAAIYREAAITHRSFSAKDSERAHVQTLKHTAAQTVPNKKLHAQYDNVYI